MIRRAIELSSTALSLASTACREYAALRDDGQTFPLESASYDGERLAAAEQFPAVVATVLRKFAGSR
jgi:hypothetical protein